MEQLLIIFKNSSKIISAFLIAVLLCGLSFQQIEAAVSNPDNTNANDELKTQEQKDQETVEKLRQIEAEKARLQAEARAATYTKQGEYQEIEDYLHPKTGLPPMVGPDVYNSLTERQAQLSAEIEAERRASVSADAAAATASNSQGANYVQGNTNTVSNQTGQAVGGATTNAGTCVGAAQVIALAKYGLQQAIPEKWTSVNAFIGSIATKDGASGIVGWDAVGYCIVNAMIEYIANSTIAWINGGFNGNPAFVEDPGQFFKDIATTQAAGFLQEVVKNTTGLDICQPFRLEIATGLGAGGGTGIGGTQCTLDSIAANAQNFQAYMSGASPQSGNLTTWNQMTQQPQNNVYGAYLIAQNQLANRIAVKQNTATLDLTTGNGFLSFKKCNPDSKTTDPNTGKTIQVKGACKVSTPGSVIEEQLNSRLKLGTDRLVLAEKFDQVVNALVNTLIKTALSKALEGVGTSN